jgi:hypothetical protein
MSGRLGFEKHRKSRELSGLHGVRMDVVEPRNTWLPAPPISEPTPVVFEPFRAPDRPASPRRPPRFKRRRGPILAALIALVAKLKTLILLLPKLKVLTTAGTMFVSVAAYSLLWG